MATSKKTRFILGDYAKGGNKRASDQDRMLKRRRVVYAPGVRQLK